MDYREKLEYHAERINSIAVARQRIAAEYATKAYSVQVRLYSAIAAGVMSSGVLSAFRKIRQRPTPIIVALSASFGLATFVASQDYDRGILLAEDLEDGYCELEHEALHTRDRHDVEQLYERLATLERKTEYVNTVYPAFPMRELTDDEL